MTLNLFGILSISIGPRQTTAKTSSKLQAKTGKALKGFDRLLRKFDKIAKKLTAARIKSNASIMAFEKAIANEKAAQKLLSGQDKRIGQVKTNLQTLLVIEPEKKTTLAKPIIKK